MRARYNIITVFGVYISLYRHTAEFFSGERARLLAVCMQTNQTRTKIMMYYGYRRKLMYLLIIAGDNRMSGIIQ